LDSGNDLKNLNPHARSKLICSSNATFIFVILFTHTISFIAQPFKLGFVVVTKDTGSDNGGLHVTLLLDHWHRLTDYQ